MIIPMLIASSIILEKSWLIHENSCFETTINSQTSNLKSIKHLSL